jgi:hypothetical protein
MKKWKIALALLLAVFGAAYAALAAVSPEWADVPKLDSFSPDEERLDASEPCTGVSVRQGDDLAAIANASPEGTTFCISGFHRLSGEIVPKDGQRFIGVEGPVLNGSRLLTSFSQASDFWVIGGQTQDYAQAAPKIADESCMEGYEGCRFPEDVYLDDAFLHQVLSLEELEPGRYFFDYAADEIYLADDQAGHEVEASVVRRAFANYDGADDVVIRGLVIEKFSAYSGEDGVVGAFNGANWLVEDNEIRLNHGSGIIVSETDRMVIRGNHVHHNGCGGIMGAGATSLLIDGNEIASNNTLNYQSNLWSCGGGKLVGADGVVVRTNHLHDNNGFGFWTDGMNVNVVYEHNTFEDNSMGGLMHEINDGTAGSTVIRDNIFRRNGFAHPNRVMFGAAIIISASNHVEIIGNTLEGNAHGITLNYTPRTDLADRDLAIHDILIRNNVIGLRYGDDPSSDVGRVGFYTSTVGAPAPTKITFAGNQYFLGDPLAGPHFSLPHPAASNTLTTATDWQSAGFDSSSEFLPATEFPSHSSQANDG